MLQVWYADTVEPDFVDAALITLLQIHIQEDSGSGDIIVFLPGQVRPPPAMRQPSWGHVHGSAGSLSSVTCAAQEDIESLTVLVQQRIALLPKASDNVRAARPLEASEAGGVHPKEHTLY